MGAALHHAPAIVIAKKDCSGAVVDVAGVEDRADFIQRNPFPGKFDIGDVALLGDAGDRNQLAARGGNVKGLRLRIGRGDETLQRIHARWCEHDIPARRRGQSWRAGGVGAGNPAVMLQQEIAGREVVLVGDDAGTQLKLLLGSESIGTRDQISGKTASEKVAGRTGWEKEQADDTQNEDGWFPHK